jgi:hypothetical protein
MTEMINPLASLGLDKVSGDPNSVPDGKYDGEIVRSEYVTSERQDTISHVVTLQVTGGDANGKQKPKFFQLGKEPRDSQGNFAQNFSDVANYTPTMSDDNKDWYKKFLLDMGVPENEINGYDISKLVGTKVTFGVKTKDGYSNVNFVEKRDASNEAPASAVATAGGLGGLL